MNQSETTCQSHGGALFISGLTFGLSVGMMLGGAMVSSRRDMKKMARRTTQSVGEAMENLKESLQHYM